MLTCDFCDFVSFCQNKDFVQYKSPCSVSSVVEVGLPAANLRTQNPTPPSPPSLPSSLPPSLSPYLSSRILSFTNLKEVKLNSALYGDDFVHSLPISSGLEGAIPHGSNRVHLTSKIRKVSNLQTKTIFQLSVYTAESARKS